MDFSRPFLAFSLSKSRILLNLLFLLLLRYLQVSVSQNFLVNHFLAEIAKTASKCLLTRSTLDISQHFQRKETV